jgi:hypothetical protein
MSPGIKGRLLESTRFYKSQLEILDEEIDALKMTASKEYSRLLEIDKDLNESEDLLDWLQRLCGDQ